MSYEALDTEALRHGLIIMGALYPESGTLVLLGTGDGFWEIFSASDEYADGQCDPLDRWSKRVIGTMAAERGAECHFPSDGPPYPPFISWALESGRFHTSPINMMVHDEAGLMISLRGALHVPEKLAIPVPGAASPCTSCKPQPCRASCPVDAFAKGVYDVDGCRNQIGGQDETECLSRGCAARRACPVSQGYGRLEEQSSYHMRVFLENGL